MTVESSRRIDVQLAWLVMAAAFCAYLAVFLPFIPADGHGLGPDYRIHLPNLLAGTFILRANGPLAVPWFNPGECGGVPFLADLNVGYYAVPQVLSFLTDPLTAVRATFVVFAALGCVGFYWLMRRSFGLSPLASALAGVLFLFNGTFAYRMIIGHLTFHPWMLAPWAALLLLEGGVLGTLLAGVLFAYSFQAGMIHGIGPMAAAVVVIFLIRGMRSGHSLSPYLALAASAVVALALSASRFVAAVAFDATIPRDEYNLPGFADPLHALRFALESLFVYPPWADGWSLLVNRGVYLARVEWEYGIGCVAALLIVAGAVALLPGLRRAARHLPAVAAIAVILALPLLLNWYTPAWNAILRRVPLIGSSTTLLRWFMLYEPVAVLVAALAFERLFRREHAVLALPLATLLVVVLAADVDKGAYRALPYDGSPVVAAWHRGGVVPVTRLVRSSAADSSPASYDLNNAMADGASELNCHQPVFGYWLEKFPAGALHPGPVLAHAGTGVLNIKNPACYLFPAANGCRPGDEFRDDQASAAAAFAAYRSFPFARPLVQVAADWVNLAAVLALLAALLLYAVRAGLDAFPRAR